ncbi:MAG: leucyl aminopeptidase [Nocardioidaceae bacterium]
MTSVSLRSASATTTRTDVLVIGAHRSGKAVVAADAGNDIAAAFGRKFDTTLSTLGFKGKLGDIAKLPSSGVVSAALVLVVGLGDADDTTDDSLRRAAGSAMRALNNAASVAVALPTGSTDQLQAVCEGVLLGGYQFDRYKSEPDRDRPGSVVVLTEHARSKGGKRALQVAETVAAAVNQARDWVNSPARDLTPEAFADAVSSRETSAKVKVTVWDETKLERERCGGTLGVGQGSDNPPRMVQVAWKPKKPVAHLVLVGKGITFDSGGLNIKAVSGMQTMKCDMAGAAAVLTAAFAIAELDLPVQVTAIAAMAENMPGGGATRPGDVLTIRNGTTVEVHNTDAEGRLVLADALSIGREAKPDVMLDVATLTGACVVGLGDRTSGVMSNDDRLREAVPAAATRAGEVMWPLPIAEEMRAKVRSSHVADIRQHNPQPVGGALYAAAFLREFVGDTRWAHLDIAGPAFNSGDAFGYTPRGATGAAVRTLIRVAQEMSDGSFV